MTENKKPKLSNSASQQELDKAEKQLDSFEQNIKEMTLDRMNMAPKQDSEGVTLSQKDIEKSQDIYIKPSRIVGSREKFNEDYREEYNFAKEYVRCIPKHNEIIGEVAEFWTKPFAGVPAEFWQVPTGKPVFIPRYAAEQLTKCRYHRFVMQQNVSTGTDGHGQYFGSMAVDTIIQRLDALPVSNRKSIFMGASF
jgi:hypothetical protein